MADCKFFNYYLSIVKEASQLQSFIVDVYETEKKQCISIKAAKRIRQRAREAKNKVSKTIDAINDKFKVLTKEEEEMFKKLIYLEKEILQIFLQSDRKIKKAIKL